MATLIRRAVLSLVTLLALGSTAAAQNHPPPSARQGSHDQAIAACRRALALDDSGENHAALAEALVRGAQGRERDAALSEARMHADVAVQRLPDDEFAWYVLLGVLGDLALPRPTGGWVELVFPFPFSPGGEAAPEE